MKALLIFQIILLGLVYSLLVSALEESPVSQPPLEPKEPTAPPEPTQPKAEEAPTNPKSPDEANLLEKSNNAATDESELAYSKHVFGVKFLLGAAGQFTIDHVSHQNEFSNEFQEKKGFRLAGGAALTYHYRFTRLFALNFGAGLLGKGYQYSESDEKIILKTLHFEMPIGILLTLGSVFRVGMDLVASIALSAKQIYKFEDETYTHIYQDGYWEDYRRYNINPRISALFAIPVNIVDIILGLSWQMDLLNYHYPTTNQDNYGEGFMNIMGIVGMEYGL